jgi:hypothetical protein
MQELVRPKGQIEPIFGTTAPANSVWPWQISWVAGTGTISGARNSPPVMRSYHCDTRRFWTQLIAPHVLTIESGELAVGVAGSS